jgi:hypothetical protein
VADRQDHEHDQEQEYSVEWNDGHGVTAPKMFSRQNPEQRVRPAQTVKRVRFLPADRVEFSLRNLTPDIMGPVPIVVHAAGKSRVRSRQKKLIVAGAH